MQEELNQYFAGRSSTAKSTFPYLHQVFSKNEDEKYINQSCKQSSHFQHVTETLHSILTQTNFDTIDDALNAIGYEYYRLASLPELDEYSSHRMLLILSLAEIDIKLSHLINSIDAFLATDNKLDDFRLFSSDILPDSNVI
ncbi:hypothetical protein NIES4071_31530 [Calothrix sp. NIES-4071]|nr:hypothetical protein NIES4071_31530 [Calothrix sp. NIES-4071]BAZ57473.1 hypothetical protein NIES4105_31470 [Calothrix sp. NIES-4105]